MPPEQGPLPSGQHRPGEPAAAVSQCLEPFAHPCDAREDSRHGMHRPVPVLKPVRRVHEPPALSKQGHTILRRTPDCLPDRPVLRKTVCEFLGKPSPDIDSVRAGWKRYVPEGAEGDDLRSQLFKDIQVVLVVEVKRLVHGCGDPDFWPGGRRGEKGLRKGGQERGPVCDPEEPVQVQELFRHLPECCDQTLQTAVLGGGRKAEMALGKGDRIVPGEVSEDRNARIFFHRPFYDAVVPGAPEIVEKNRLHMHPPVEPGETPDQSRGASCHGLAVHHEDHGRREDFCQVCGAAPLVEGSGPVEKTHDSLYDRDVRLAGAPFKKLQQPPFREEHSVEAAAGSPRRQGVEAGVDVIRTRLVWLDQEPPFPQGGHDGHGQCCFSRSAVGSCENDPRQRHFSIPFLAGTPCEK